ncbi:uncharacterized protein A4U43_C08F31990 [Asparagus officinalis]|nr:uncharacterized protein A4U43_C08F31990 [Asparagus officinalis]
MGAHWKSGLGRGKSDVQRGPRRSDLLEPKREHIQGPTVGAGPPYGGKSGYHKLKLAACCKHYTAYDLDNWQGVDRFHFNAKVSKQDLEDTFNVPFKACVQEGKVASIMCSYNQVNGVPTCADPNLLRNTIRGEWGLDGYIVSDCDSVGVFFNSQHYTKTPEDAAAGAIKAGLDLDCGPFLAQYTQGALNQRKISEADVDNALANTLTVQMRLGMFDGEPSKQPFGNLGPRDVCTPAHKNLALEAARQGIVLLKNDRRSLPLSPSRLRHVAVIGPNADVTATMIGNYAGVPCGYTSPLEGIGKYVRTNHQAGCTDVFVAAVEPIDAAGDCQLASQMRRFLWSGCDQSIEAEMVDRATLLLPGRQQELVTKVAAASRAQPSWYWSPAGPLTSLLRNNNRELGPSLGRIPGPSWWAGYCGRSLRCPQSRRKAPSDMVPRGIHSEGDSPSSGPTYRSARWPSGCCRLKLDRTEPGGAGQPLGMRQLVRTGTRGRQERGRYGRGPHGDGVLEPTGRTPGPAEAAHCFREGTRGGAGGQARVVFGVDVCRDLSFADVYGIRRVPIGDHGLEIGGLSHSLSLKAETKR